MGTDLNPTESTFGGDPEKMSNEGQNVPLIGHLRPQALPQAGTPDETPHEKSKIFPAGTPIYPVPISFNTFLFQGRRGGYLTSLSEDVSPFYTLRVRCEL